ncbi:glycosyl hydrolase 53 domain-containing protein [Moniliophthora roreri MCA 2997]|uniref:Glycosyl hydrolase 53 domain-containing protein n=2 Tax=Moniliophthora roreri TaxID=221103 RepID=V2WYU8_MONRO|nr:glycosyl hydrolase 53 domain-containing protein [Moniliophthora roreri MCA 2997]
MTTTTTSSLFLFKLALYAYLLRLVAAPAFAIPNGEGPQLYKRARAVTNSSKAGLAWPGGDEALGQYLTTDKVSWYYSWSPQSGVKSTELEYVPMLWGKNQVEEFNATINQTITNLNVKAILGFNEPQEKGQSNLTPQEGADLWRTYLEPLRSSRNVRLGSPAPSSAPSGKVWIQEFLEACNGGCTVDFIAMHYYDVNATDFIRYLNDYHDTFQRPLWITEWACQNFNPGNQCSYDDIVLFLNKTQSFMDETEWVERYSWFGALWDLQGVNKDNALMTSAGELTDLGAQYIGAKPPMTSGGGNADGPNAPGGGGGSRNDATTKNATWYTLVGATWLTAALFYIV